MEATNEAVARYGRPETFNTDQGSQFASEEFTSVLLALEIKISMDGKGRCIDNIFVERRWWYAEVLRGLPVRLRHRADGARGFESSCYFDFSNDVRPHKAIAYQTPASFYDAQLGEVYVMSAAHT